MSATINAQEASKLQIQKLGSQPAANTADISLWKKQIELALKSHELQVEYALQSWTNRGLSSIPEKNLDEIRKRTLDQLKRTMDRLRQCDQSVMNDEQMMINIYYHEEKVALKFRSEKSTIGAMGKDQNVISAPTGISENKMSVPQSSTASNHVHGHSSNLFSTQNAAPSMSISPVRRSNDQTGQHQLSFGNNNPKKPPVSDQFIPEGNFLSRQPIMDQMQSSNAGNQFNKKYDEYGMQSSSSGHAGFINKPINRQPQHMPGGFQNQVQSQHLATSASYSTPNSKNGLLDGASSINNNAFTNIQQSSISKQLALSSMESAQRIKKLPQATKVQPQQQQQFSMHQNMGLYGQNLDFQPSSLNVINGVQQSPSDDPLRAYQNAVLAQADPKVYQQNLQAGIQKQHLQDYSPTITSSAAFYGNSNTNQQASHDSYARNVWSNQKSISTQHNSQPLTSEQHRSSFSVQGVVQQQHQNQFHHNQYPLDGMNHANKATETSRVYGSFPMVENFVHSNSYSLKSSLQSHSISRLPVNMEYQQAQTQEGGNQQDSNAFSLQHTVQQNSNSTQLNFNQTNQMTSNIQPGHLSVSMAPQHQQYQNPNPTSFQGLQQQHLQSQQNQQQFDQAFQSQMYMAQHQGQNKKNTQHQGKFDPGSFGNNYY
mmetsp:Transcript_9862/g.19467  ORF Transcript_9862/g.19467 Transcript_9862/m.19467 type:complete len:655 (-) Transcript_9862:64-2028(-)